MNSRGELPSLAIVFDPVSTAPMRIAQAGAGAWHTLWLVDRSSSGGQDNSVRLLPRLGTVVDITGQSPAGAARQLAKHSPDGILALGEAELPLAAQIAAELGLTFHSPEAALRLTSKVAQRAALMAAGLPTPSFWPVPHRASTAELRRALEAVPLPAILKPQSGSSSRNTYRISNGADLIIALAEIHTNFYDVSADFILEEILSDGWDRDQNPHADYASVETIAVAGECHHVALTGRTPLADPFRETGFFTPAHLPGDIVDSLERLATQAIVAISPEVPVTGAFHTEIKFTTEGPRIIEVNGRPGGIWIPEIVEMVGGPSILTLAGRAALGLPLDLPEEPALSGVGYELQYQAPVGAIRLNRIDGVQEIAHLDGVRTVTLSKQPGAKLDWREGTTGSLFTVVGVASDHEALWALRRRIEEVVDAEFELAVVEPSRV